ncbi:MAG: C25 family cysteine peptidase, partial [Alphaproteobacteria bacterium]|nr:C25 family cysteine peptidase [Alphaproteobacteria bacterium]
EIRDTALLELYNVKEQFCYIHNDDFGVTDDVGYPYLPQYTMEINVPNNSYGFKISILDPKYVDVSLKHDVIPVQEDFKGRDNKYAKSDYYESDGSEQPYPIVISEPFVIMGEKGISVTIFPFLYNPKKNKLRVLTHAKFKISYSLTSNQNDCSEPSDVKKRYLKNFFANYNTDILKSGSSFCGKYLIITDATFEETLSSFANYKRNIGYDVDVYTTNTTGNTVTSIKNFIQAKYDNTATRPDFVLLVGDYSKIPASCGSVSYDIDNPISDLNYARLAGSDYFADVFLGRFPVGYTVELQNIINKTIYMEMNLHSFDKEAVFIAGAENNNWMQNQFENGHDYVVSETFNPEGYTCHKLYQPSISSIINAINDNPLYVVYSGHGNETCLEGISFSLCKSDFSDINNRIYPFIFSFACRTGRFSNQNCFGDSILANVNGAVTYFGSSVETMVNSDKAIEKKIFGDAFTDEEHISAIIGLGMKRYWERFWSSLAENKTERYMKAYNLLGDPSLNILGLGCRTSWNFQNPEVFCNNADITYAATNHITNNNSF